MADADWTHSPAAYRIAAHRDDRRPAWLWSGDGQTLLWRNTAAAGFGTRLKKQSLRVAPMAVPIRGQVARLMRLGSLNRASLARVQFLVGQKPASATCTCTPLPLPNTPPGLLIVGVDPIDAEVLAALQSAEAGAHSLPLAALLPTPDGVAAPASPEEVGSPNEDPGGAEAAAEDAAPVELELVPDNAVVVAADEDEVGRTASSMGDPIAAPLEENGRLTSLFDRLANATELYAPLPEDARPQDQSTPEDEPAAEGEPPIGDEPDAEDDSPAEDAPVDGDLPSAAQFVDASGGESEQQTADIAATARQAILFRLIGRGFTPRAAVEASEAAGLTAENGEAEAVEAQIPFGADETAPVAADRPDDAVAASPPSLYNDDDVDVMPAAPLSTADAQTLERVSRYNFDELSRLLNDRIGGGEGSGKTSIEALIAADEGPAAAPANGGGALINLGGETLVLNRLPLGILVFRDQQVLFANRAITEMIGYPSVEALRAAGLAAIFPAAGPETPEAGPVNHLVTRDGTMVPVTARLQSISWQGRPALMLSASSTEVRTGHEGAVQAFAALLAEARHDGYIETSRTGMISAASASARMLLASRGGALVGRSLATLIRPEALPALKRFLERPARFAETSRPWVALPGAAHGVELTLFTQGQAGIVSGYFGLVRETGTALASPDASSANSALLARLSRGISGPLNAILGFADLLGGAATDAADANRLPEYADDIRIAGHEIQVLIDELDHYVRLTGGRYVTRPAEIDLLGLLESSIVRVRSQAARGRVLVRSGISEALPPVRADRASLGESILNLLGSAVDQTRPGGSVVIAAQREDDGALSVSIRDNAANDLEASERFVVFRDGVAPDGSAQAPVRSSVGLALTRALLAVNGFELAVETVGSGGTLFSVRIPAGSVIVHAVAELPQG